MNLVRIGSGAGPINYQKHNTRRQLTIYPDLYYYWCYQVPGINRALTWHQVPYDRHSTTRREKEPSATSHRLRTKKILRKQKNNQNRRNDQATIAVLKKTY